MKIKQDEILFLMALPDESQGLVEQAGYQVHYTGVGKVNAAYTLTKNIHTAKAQQNPYKMVVNFGSAGSKSLPKHSIIAIDRFIQHDMDVTPLGFAKGHTPFDVHPQIINQPRLLNDITYGTCASGDSFITTTLECDYDCIDMEAFALAKICHIEQLPFVCVKYITDGADHESPQDWELNLENAAKGFVKILRENFINRS